MKLFEGKTPSERNKIIVALVLGVLSVLAIGNMIFQPFSGSKKVTVNVSPTPSASATPARTGDTVVTALPRQNEIDAVYTSIPVSMNYPPGGGDPGRNIFAFYEPPIPTPYSPTPYVEPKTPKPTEMPTPIPHNVFLASMSRQMVYAGDRSFRLDVGGDKFTPETYIFFNGAQLPTNYVSPQQMWAEVPANYFAGAGQATIEVRSMDGKLFSNQLYLNIKAPEPPQFTYLGIVSRKRGNNDTAYVMEQGKTTPSTFRLGELISGRYRVIRITPERVLVQDMQLTFVPPYSVDLVKGSGGSSTTTTFNRSNPTINDPSIVQPNPNVQCPPGIPCDRIRPYQTPQPQKKDDDDVDDDGDGNN